MNVRLVSTTKSHIQEKELNAEELIVYTARVSNPENQLNTETSENLIKFLIRNKHWSPFEMVDMTVEITTSRGIAQQILRHRSFSFQEFSQRYSKVTAIEPIALRYKADKNRQSSSNDVEGETKVYLDSRIENHNEQAQILYDEMLEFGVAKECARFVLPLATQTTMYMKGSVRSWIHYLQIRCAHYTQLEHREIADAILEIFKQNFPIIYESIEFKQQH